MRSFSLAARGSGETVPERSLSRLPDGKQATEIQANRWAGPDCSTGIGAVCADRLSGAHRFLRERGAMPQYRARRCRAMQADVPYRGRPGLFPARSITHRRGCEPPDELRKPFVDWFNAEVWLDVEWIARCRPAPQWCAGLNALYTASCR
jgi:hypothetical protein